MLPTKEELINHLKDKMTNEDIARLYNTSFQKIIALIHKYELNADEIRETEKYIVYAHIYEGKVIYIGSGVWYRCRRYSNRRNSYHKELMRDGKIKYMILASFKDRDEAYKLEGKLIELFKSIGQADLNIQQLKMT